jgi:glycerol kinase
LAVGFWKSKDDVVKNWAVDKEFKPGMESDRREAELKGWSQAVKSTLDWAK